MYYVLKMLYSTPVWIIEARVAGEEYCRDSTPHIEYGPFDYPAEAHEYIEAHA